MKESEFTQTLLKELRRYSVRGFKLHNDAEQRGLPDAVIWKEQGRLTHFESKIESDPVKAMLALSSGQRSILVSMAMIDNPPLLVFGEPKDNVWHGGFIKLRRHRPWFNKVDGSKSDFFLTLAMYVGAYCDSHMVNSDFPIGALILDGDFK